MFFRFAAGLILVVLVSMVGIGLEKQSLQLRRAVSGQYFQKDLLLEMHAQMRLKIQTLTAPSQLARIDYAPAPSITPQESTTGNRPESTALPASPSLLPLLRWEHPARPSD